MSLKYIINLLKWVYFVNYMHFRICFRTYDCTFHAFVRKSHTDVSHQVQQNILLLFCCDLLCNFIPAVGREGLALANFFAAKTILAFLSMVTKASMGHSNFLPKLLQCVVCTYFIEELIDILCSFCRCFKKNQAIFLSILLTFLQQKK